MVLTSFANLLSNLYRQIGPAGPEPKLYECEGYARDSAMLESVNKSIENALNQGANVPQRYYLLREQVQNCLSDVGNIIAGSSQNDPSLGLYIGVAGAVAGGIGGLAWYMKSRSVNNKSKRIEG